MGRWEPNARGRLEMAALELFGDGGFEQTTVAEIAERAGLTERTFFRYFADKREVLFAGAARLEELLVTRMLEMPDDAGPMETVESAIGAAGVMLQENRDFARRRADAISSNVELKERELIKLAALASAMSDALERRGVQDPVASLSAEAGVAVFKVAFERWVKGDGKEDLPSLVKAAFGELRAVTNGA